MVGVELVNPGEESVRDTSQPNRCRRDRGQHMSVTSDPHTCNDTPMHVLHLHTIKTHKKINKYIDK